MKLEKILDKLNFVEKNSFLGIVKGITDKSKKNKEEIDKILNDSNGNLKKTENINIAKIFNLIEDEFFESIKTEFAKSTSQFDILTDIISRDGNCIMKRDRFARLYKNEINNLKIKLEEFIKSLEDEKSVEENRRRDYLIYKACLATAYNNDSEKNRDRKITSDEQSILLTLSDQLGLSQEEIKLINYLIIEPKEQDIDLIIKELKSLGVIFYLNRTSTIYVADEIVKILRKARGKKIADKFFRRVLRLLRKPQINLICKRHNIDRKLPLDQKIKKIINEGISFTDVLINDIHKDGTKITDKKKIINDLCDKGLKISPPLKGSTIEDKITNLIKYFEEVERDEKGSISIDGYEKLLKEMGEVLPDLNGQLKTEFELDEENILIGKDLLDYNIKPRDLLEIISASDLEIFCKAKNIKTRGDLINNILDAYKDAENIYLENYENIGFRKLNVLKENGIRIKEGELGVKFEELTKTIFRKLGFNVDEKLRKKLNTAKDIIDIVLNLGNNDLIIIECKTVKDRSYNKFSAVSKQLKSYKSLAERNNYKVDKILLIAPDFSDDFINACRRDCEINLSLITASTLINILGGFKTSKYKKFPHNLFMKDVLIQEDRTLLAIDK